MTANTDPAIDPWTVSGTYFEACNCDAICPCRSVGGRPGGRSTHGHCDFALSWRILDGRAGRAGRAGQLDLSGLDVVMAGTYDDDPTRPSPRGHGWWAVTLYVDQRASTAQHDALSRIFLGQAGGSTFSQFAGLISEIHAVRRADVHLDHHPTRPTIEVPDHVTVRARQPVETPEPVSCAIPGHHHPGQEWVADVLQVHDEPLVWTIEGRCGFATDFAYTSAA